MAAAFLIGILFSLFSPDKEAEAKYNDEKIRSYIGIGSEE
jgi:cation/acetate symporter